MRRSHLAVFGFTDGTSTKEFGGSTQVAVQCDAAANSAHIGAVAMVITS